MGRTDAEAETPVLWPPDAKNGLIGKDPDAGKDWRQEEKGTEGAIQWWVEWYHWLNGHEFEQALGVGDGHGSLACCSLWGRKESNITELTRSWPPEWQDPAPPTRKPAQTSGPTSATRGQTWEEKLWSSGLKQRKERGRTKFKVRRKERKIRAEIETNNGKKTESFFFKNVNKID